MAHRLVLDYAARLEGWDGRRVVAALLEAIPEIERGLPQHARGEVDVSADRASAASAVSRSLICRPPRVRAPRVPHRRGRVAAVDDRLGLGASERRPATCRSASTSRTSATRASSRSSARASRFDSSETAARQASPGRDDRRARRFGSRAAIACGSRCRFRSSATTRTSGSRSAKAAARSSSFNYIGFQSRAPLADASVLFVADPTARSAAVAPKLARTSAAAAGSAAHRPWRRARSAAAVSPGQGRRAAAARLLARAGAAAGQLARLHVRPRGGDRRRPSGSS